MTRRDRTIMGGQADRFETTVWDDIARVRTGDGAHRREALDCLLRRYWKPVYCYLRRKGYDNDEAKDLTQGFFHEVVLGRGLIHQASAEKGRFRTFLLTALEHYAASVHRAQTADKRTPSSRLASLEGLDVSVLPKAVDGADPAKAFDFVWASTLLDHVLDHVQKECLRRDEATYWDVFHARVLRPIMDNTEPPPLTDLCTAFGIPDETTASNMIVTVKRRFRAALESSVRQSVHSQAEVDEEIRDLLKILSENRAGSNPSLRSTP